jgi:hypothetical protein
VGRGAKRTRARRLSRCSRQEGQRRPAACSRRVPARPVRLPQRRARLRPTQRQVSSTRLARTALALATPAASHHHTPARRALGGLTSFPYAVAKWGSHPPVCAYQPDQLPLPLVNGQETTYAEKGAKRVSTSAEQDALTKRQFTAQLAFRPDMPPRPADPAAAAVWDTRTCTTSRARRSSSAASAACRSARRTPTRRRSTSAASPRRGSTA